MILALLNKVHPLKPNICLNFDRLKSQLNRMVGICNLQYNV